MSIPFKGPQSIRLAVMMVSVSELYILQELDLAMDAKKGRLANIEGQLGETEDLLASRDTVARKKEEVWPLREQQKDLEWQINETRKKASQVEKTLYGGSVRNPKELEDLQQDLQAIQRQIRSKEDELLRLMLELEEAEQAFKQLESTSSALEAQWRVTQEMLEAEKVQLLAEIVELEGRRASQKEKVEMGVLNLYDGLRARRQGRAVAKVERGMCQGCRITLPLSVLQKARASLALVQCVSCERILYVS